MADGEGEVGLPPAAIDRMDIATADTATLNLDFDIEFAKGFGVKLVLVECYVRGWRFHLEALVLVVLRLRHSRQFGD